jgi:hypothetical protein
MFRLHAFRVHNGAGMAESKWENRYTAEFTQRMVELLRVGPSPEALGVSSATPPALTAGSFGVHKN